METGSTHAQLLCTQAETPCHTENDLKYSSVYVSLLATQLTMPSLRKEHGKLEKPKVFTTISPTCREWRSLCGKGGGEEP